MGMGRIIALVLIDGVETHVEDEGARRIDRRTIREVIDADLHATAGASLGFGIGAEREEGEERDAGRALGERRKLHEMEWF